MGSARACKLCHAGPPHMLSALKPAPPSTVTSRAPGGGGALRSVPPDFASACNSLDEVWVPSEFSRAVLAASGVEASKVGGWAHAGRGHHRLCWVCCRIS